MFEVVSKIILAKDIKRMDIKAPVIARKIRPGQFVIVVPEEKAERVPLAVADTDQRKGTVTVVFQEIGQATQRLGMIPIGQAVFSVAGPLGLPSQITKTGTVLCVAAGLGAAQLLPICRAAKAAGNKVVAVLGAKTRKEIMLETQMRLACYRVILSTQDSPHERKGPILDLVADLLDRERIDLVYAVGPVDMMQAVCGLTREKKIKTLIQSSGHILCGMGICGACRTRVAGKVVLSCREGPEFDGHQVDFDFMRMRQRSFKGSAEGVDGFWTGLSQGKKYLSRILEGSK